jgi:hypothetical protein
MGNEFVTFSLTPILIGIFAAVACALPGNFLILRRQALIGDAISHVVLPGIVVAFLLTGAVSSLPMLLGAAGAAVVAVVLIELVKRVGQVEPGAAMGVVFTTLFAAGVLLLEQSDTSSVHLDVEHALMGNLESLIWLRAEGWASLLDPVALSGLPPEARPHGALLCRHGRPYRRLLALAEDRDLRRRVCERFGNPCGGSGVRAGHRLGGCCGRGIRRGGVHHRDRDVHLSPCGRAPDDVESRASSALVRRLRHGLGRSGVCPCRLRTDLAGRGGFRQRRRDDGNGVGAPVRACLSCRSRAPQGWRTAP